LRAIFLLPCKQKSANYPSPRKRGEADHQPCRISAIERGLGGWQAEWDTLPEIFDATFTALNHAIEVIEELEIDAERMAANLNASHGLIMAEAVSMTLAQFVGKAEAHRIVEQACHRAQRDAKRLLEILVEDVNVRAHLSKSQLNELMDPANYLGATEKIIEQVLQRVDGP
jgi:3-carboxy-cis,cis-muconate cycloisomerase